MKHKNDDDDSHLSEEGRRTQTLRERIEADGRLKAANAQKERFVRLGHIKTGSPAWQELDSYARDAYAWTERRYKGTNNGLISMSVRELAEDMGVNTETANRAQLRLQALGFIAQSRKGQWAGPRGKRRATLWRLTEYKTKHGPATKDYLDILPMEAKRLFREAGKRDPEKLHPNRKVRQERKRPRENFISPTKPDAKSDQTGRTGPTKPDTDPISVHGNWHSGSDQTGQSAAVPGEVGNWPASHLEATCAPEASGRSCEQSVLDAPVGKRPRSSSKHKKARGPHAKRSAAANSLNGADDIKEKVSVIEKRRKRELKNLARKFQ